MPIELKMPALSPTMEEGTLAKWLVKEGDEVSSGDILAEIETDKATMEFEAVDEGTIAKILVAEGTDGVKVGQPIAILAGEGEDATQAAKAEPGAKGEKEEERKGEEKEEAPKAEPEKRPEPEKTEAEPKRESKGGDRIKASPLARRIAEEKGLDLSSLQGSGPGGRIVKADLEKAPAQTAAPAKKPAATVEAGDPSTLLGTGIPHEVVKLSNMRKTIARRLTEAKQTIPHIYLTVDIRSTRC
jgi:pyruvate dehydrogenase E2 component (dihydrolipoamide acetyltransferase)